MTEHSGEKPFLPLPDQGSRTFPCSATYCDSEDAESGLCAPAECVTSTSEEDS